MEPTAAPVRALGIAGSLRADSLNRKLLAAAVDLAPDDLEIEVYTGMRDLPHYDADLAPEPESVLALRAAVERSDALVLVTPEYNFGIPGVLKNALDWASTPPGRSVMNDKPVAIMGASPGMLGTARAQQQLRACLTFTRNPAVLHPEVLVAFAPQKFDAQGRLTDALSVKLVRRHLENLVTLVRRSAPSGPVGAVVRA